MKKIFAFAIAAVTMTVGCQKIQELVNPDRNQTSFDDNEPVEITFNTNVVNVETKAANGSVTTFDPDKHKLYVYGLNTTNNGVKEITNALATTNAGATPASLTLDKPYFYNGTDDKYDFYGYYVDDAADPATVAADYTLPVTITGQQDILLAKALGSEASDGVNPIVDAYSAKTARAGVVPNLQFEHQMSQFSFNVRNCGSYAITLKGLSLNTINKGTLTVAGASRGLEALTGDANKADIEVSTTEQSLAEVDKLDSENYTPIGQPIMVFSENAYTVILYLWQTGMEANKVRKVTVPVTITNDPEDLTDAGITGTDPGALKGYAYEINVTVYSLEEITVTASIVGWKTGASFVFDTEDGTTDGETDVDWPVTPTPTPTTPEFAATAVLEEIAADATTFTVNVTLDGDAPETEEGITVDAGELAAPVFNAGTYTFTVLPNDGAEDVVYNVTFTYGTQEETVTVTHMAPGA